MSPEINTRATNVPNPTTSHFVIFDMLFSFVFNSGHDSNCFLRSTTMKNTIIVQKNLILKNKDFFTFII